MSAVIATSALLLLTVGTSATAADAEIPVGASPEAIAYSADGTHAYVANSDSNSVSVIDLATNSVTATIPVGTTPRSLAVNPNGQTVFVSSPSTGSVSVISTSTQTVTATLTGFFVPQEIAFSPSGDIAYVVNEYVYGVSVIDTSTNGLLGTIPLPDESFGIAISPDGSKLYATNMASSTVTVISTATRSVITTIGVGNSPYRVAVSPDGTLAYVTNIGDGTISVIDATTDTLNSVTPSIPSGTQPIDVEFAPSGLFAYVGNANGSVRVIDTGLHAIDTSLPPITGGAGSAYLAVSPDGETLLLSNRLANSVSVRDLPIAPSITSSAPPAATVGTAYSFTVTSSGRPDAAYSVSLGALPTGLSLDSTTGEISGTPTVAATATFTISADNVVGPAATANYSIVVAPAGMVTAPLIPPVAPLPAADPTPLRALPDTGADPGMAGSLGALAVMLGAVLLAARVSRRRQAR